MKKLRIFDYILMILLLFLVIIAVITGLKMRETSSNQIEDENAIKIVTFFRTVVTSSNEMPFKVDEDAFMTIRNIPHKKLKIVEVEMLPKKVLIPNPKDLKNPILVDDISQPNQYDCKVTVVDNNAKKTNDGFVIGGNKIKIGLPITLEGFDYRFSGVVSDISVIDDKKEVVE